MAGETDGLAMMREAWWSVIMSVTRKSEYADRCIEIAELNGLFDPFKGPSEHADRSGEPS